MFHSVIGVCYLSTPNVFFRSSRNDRLSTFRHLITVGTFARSIRHLVVDEVALAAFMRLTVAVVKNTEASDEMITFMKSLNGKLAKATIQTVKEQNVEHAHIDKLEVTEK